MQLGKICSLPDDCIVCFLGFIQTPRFGLVCRRWNRLGHLPFVLWRVSSDNDVKRCKTLAQSLNSTPYGFHCDIGRGPSDDVIAALLDSFPGLLCIDLLRIERWRHPTASETFSALVFPAVGKLCRLSGLRLFHLDLTGVRLSCRDLADLMEVRKTAGLLKLTLNLSGCALGNDHVPALCDCSLCPTFLSLGLADNEIAEAGVSQLFQCFAQATALQNLHLNLLRNSYHGSALDSLAFLRLTPRLRELNLALGPNQPAAAHCIASLKHCAVLVKLSLVLAHNALSPEAAAELLELGECRSLERVALDLAGNQVRDEGLAYLCQLGAFPQLRGMRVDVRHNLVTDASAPILVACAAHCTQLTDLVVCLRGNLFTRAGYAPLAAVGRSGVELMF
eukprot:RCo028864